MSLKACTGKSEKKLYGEAMDFYKLKWNEKIQNIKETEIKTLNTAKNKVYTNYKEAYYLPDESIIAIKSSLKKIPAFYKILPAGTEKKITDTDANFVSYSNNKAVWTRKINDTRWEYRDYSDIMIFDFNSGKERQITRKGKHFSPTLSPDGSRIAVIEYGSDMKSNLVVLNTESGKEIKRFPNPENETLRTPAWSANGEKIVFTSSKYDGIAMLIVDFESGNTTEILSHSHENIGRPVFYKDFILFNSPRNGIGNIYAININSKDVLQVSSRKFGAYNPKVYNNKMIFSDYTVNGYNIAEIELNSDNWTKAVDIQNYEYDNYSHLVMQEQNKNLMTSELIPTKKYEVTDYEPLKNSVKIHSWGIFPVGESGFDFSINSTNLLNTVFGVVGTQYDMNENVFTGYAGVKLAKYFLVFDISTTYGNRNVNYSAENEVDMYDFWTETSGNLAVSLPFNFSKGICSTKLKLKAKYSFKKIYNKDYRYQLIELGNTAFSVFDYNLTFTKYKKYAPRDINPKFGFSAFSAYKHTPLNDDWSGNQFSALSSIYLPGLFSNHSLKLSGAYEKQGDYNETVHNSYYIFPSLIRFPRGHLMPLYENLMKFSADYTFPVLYPDFGIASVLYFKRLRANIFYDYASVKKLGDYKNTIYSSAGAELFLQFNIFRIQYPFEIGWRTSYKIEPGEIANNFIIFTIPIP